MPFVLDTIFDVNSLEQSLRDRFQAGRADLLDHVTHLELVWKNSKVNPEVLARVLVYRAVCLQLLDLPGASEGLIRAKAVIDTVTDRNGRYGLKLLFGDLACIAGEYHRAIVAYRSCVDEAQDRADVWLEALALTDLGYALDMVNDAVGALEALVQALVLHRTCGNLRGEAEALYRLGLVYDNQGDPARCLQHLQEATALAARANDPIFEAVCSRNLGESFADFARFDEALPCVERAVLLGEQTKDARTVAEAQVSLGRIRALQGQHGLAAGHYAAGLGFLETAGQCGYVMGVRLSLATARLNAGDVGAENGALLGRCLVGFLASDMKLDAFQTHDQLARHFELVGDLAGALEHVRRARTLERELHRQDSERRFQELSVMLGLERAEHQASLERLERQRLEQRDLEKTILLEQARVQTSQLEELAMRDGLTGLLNRRSIDSHLEHAFDFAACADKSFCVAVLDIDHFKLVNYRFSHSIGDQVLRAIAGVFVMQARNEDLVGRYGGEEFVILMPNTSLEAAHVVCDRLRVAVQHFDWTQIHTGLQITVSVGVSVNAIGETLAGILALADERLYRAKRDGRNRVV